MGDSLTDWVLILLVLEGLPVLTFVYYLEYKKRMYLIERNVVQEEPRDSRLERRLLSGLFLTFAGSSIVLSPNIARSVGINAVLTLELLLIGIIVISAGLAMLLGYGILKGRTVYSSSSQTISEIK